MTKPLLIVESPGGRREIDLSPVDRLVVGSADECDLVLARPGVSRRHCEVVRSRLGWRVRDLGSTNGTYVNGRRVLDEPISGDGEIVVGPVLLRFVGVEAGGEEAAEETGFETVVEGPQETGVWTGAEPPVVEPAPVKTTAAPVRPGEAIRVTVHLEGRPIRSHVFADLPLRIGRASGSEIILADPLVSREHAVIERQRRSVVIRDLGSRNGTYVRGDRVKRAEIEGGEPIRIGRFVLVLEGAPGALPGVTVFEAPAEARAFEAPRLSADSPVRVAERATRRLDAVAICTSAAVHLVGMGILVALAPPPGSAEPGPEVAPVKARVILEDEEERRPMRPKIPEIAVPTVALPPPSLSGPSRSNRS